ncbi:MAG: signal peptide peptidase SppA [Ignavibacteriales bacterium]|nr:signal peptide peptidase SppA [Ignavibacteriales bacterium]
MQKSTKWFLGILAVLAFFVLGAVTLFSVVFINLDTGTEEEVVGSGQKIAVVEVFGPIYSSEDIVRQLKKYRDNSTIKAILVHVNSPGGGVAASQEIYESIKRTDEKKPVIVSFSSVAASGGYYIACGARTIVANPGSITGSIGVISQFWEVNKLLDKIGVKSNTVKGGKMKDSGNPFREMTDDERKNFQALADDIHSQFMDAVGEARNFTHEEVLAIADGRVFSGKMAYKLKLVDTLGTFDDAVRIASDAAGIDGEPAIVKEVERESIIERMFGTTLKSVAKVKEEIFDQPLLQYRMPGSW